MGSGLFLFLSGPACVCLVGGLREYFKSLCKSSWSLSDLCVCFVAFCNVSKVFITDECLIMLFPERALLFGVLTQFVTAEELTWKEERIHDYVKYTFITIAAAICAALLWRLGSTLARYRRRSHRDDNGATTGQISTITSTFKKHVLYAPISRSRKARDLIIGPGSGINFGALPTRFEAVFVATYLIVNIVFIFVDIDYTAGKGSFLYAIRNRSGAVMTANLVRSCFLVENYNAMQKLTVEEQVPLFLFASRNNPLIQILDLSFDKFNLLHRWLGRIVAME